VVVLYWAPAVLVPFAVAILLTFVLTPPVTGLERWVGRVAAVLAVVTLVFAMLGLGATGLTRQMDHADELPRYRANILAKIADVRGAGKGSSMSCARPADASRHRGLNIRTGECARPAVIIRLVPRRLTERRRAFHVAPMPRHAVRPSW
jgi:hypothetical protein